MPEVFNPVKMEDLEINAEKNLNDSTEKYKQYLQDSKELVWSIKDATKTVEHDIIEHFKAIATVLEENKRRLLQDVQEIGDARVGKVENDRTKAEETIKKIKECRGSLKKLDEMKAVEEYKEQINEIYVETKAMASSRPPDIVHDLAWMEFAIETAAGSIQCGRLKTDRKIKLKLEEEFGERWFLFNLSKARGIAVTKDGLIAVAESNSSKVSVWQKVDGEYERKFNLRTPWRVKGLNKPTDVAVMSGDKFVVVDAANTIKVFSASGEYDPNEWIKEEGTTCVTCDPRRDGKRILMGGQRDITQFDASGSALPPIAAGMVSHAIATNGKSVAISNLNGVKLFDVDTGEELLNFKAQVRGLCFDDETSSILATTSDRQIVQYCSRTGQLVSTLSEEALKDPWGLVIIPGRRLAVADGQTVKVYRIIDP